MQTAAADPTSIALGPGSASEDTSRCVSAVPAAVPAGLAASTRVTRRRPHMGRRSRHGPRARAGSGFMHAGEQRVDGERGRRVAVRAARRAASASSSWRRFSCPNCRARSSRSASAASSSWTTASVSWAYALMASSCTMRAHSASSAGPRSSSARSSRSRSRCRCSSASSRSAAASVWVMPRARRRTEVLPIPEGRASRPDPGPQYFPAGPHAAASYVARNWTPPPVRGCGARSANTARRSTR